MSALIATKAYLKSYFKGREVYVASMHQKEEVIAPLVKEHLDLNCKVPDQLDTDQLGTFTREIDRTNSVVDTLRLKCQLVLKSHPEAIVIASEGSFGQHPVLFCAQGNEEVIMLKDLKNNLEIIGKHLTTSTNFKSGFINNKKELMAFLNDVGYPEHGVILRYDPNEMKHIYKDIQKHATLLKTFNEIMHLNERVYVETDMRAYRNPTRMKAIALATESMFNCLSQICNNCKAPGFSVEKVVPGLPCELCYFPTRSTLSLVYKCKQCGFENTELHPKKKRFESAQYCDRCNP